MRRLLSHLLAVLSLALCIATVVFWFRSYTAADYLAWCMETKEIGLISTVGRIVLYDEAVIPPFRWPPPSEFRHSTADAPAGIDAYTPPNSPRHVEWLGFGVISGDTGKYRVTSRMVPHWPVAVLAAILPIRWIRGYRRRRTGGMCGKCGYDMRASPGICPECGGAMV
jgi:hypothetical protein